MAVTQEERTASPEPSDASAPQAEVEMLEEDKGSHKPKNIAKSQEEEHIARILEPK